MIPILKSVVMYRRMCIMFPSKLLDSIFFLQHVGDLGNIQADASGRASFRIENKRIKVWDLIGRALAVHAQEDDYGRGSGHRSKIDGNAGPK